MPLILWIVGRLALTPSHLIHNVNRSVPTVYWWETTQFVMIQVQVHDALTLNPTPQLHCKNQRLDFK